MKGEAGPLPCFEYHLNQTDHAQATFWRLRLGVAVGWQHSGELILELARHDLQQLIEMEVAAALVAIRTERTEKHSGYRNGSRSRLLTSQVGDISLSIPKLRAGSFFPTILEPRRRIDQALYAVIMEAWINGVSTRKVDAPPLMLV